MPKHKTNTREDETIVEHLEKDKNMAKKLQEKLKKAVSNVLMKINHEKVKPKENPKATTDLKKADVKPHEKLRRMHKKLI